MNTNLVILLLVAIVARNSVARETPDSCVSGTKIGTDLDTIEFAVTVGLESYARLTQVWNTEIITVLEEARRGIHADPKDVNLRRERALNNGVTGVMLGIEPLFEAIKIFQPELNVTAFVNDVRPRMQSANEGILAAIEAAQGDNYDEAKAEIERLGNATLAGGSFFITGLFDLFMNGTTPIPDEAEPVFACIQTQATAEVASGLSYIFEEIKILLEALRNLGDKRAVENYVSEIGRAHRKAFDLLKAEVLQKFSLLRNLVIDRYLKETGTVAGLFAIQSTSGNKYV